MNTIRILEDIKKIKKLTNNIGLIVLMVEQLAKERLKEAEEFEMSPWSALPVASYSREDYKFYKWLLEMIKIKGNHLLPLDEELLEYMNKKK